MRYQAILKILGMLLAMFSVTHLPPAAIALFSDDGTFFVFAVSFFVTLFLGFAVWFPVRRFRKQLGLREGFLLVVSFWILIATVGAIPFLLSPVQQLSLTNAFFESMSGLTTTGATILTNIDSLPKSILYYRQQLQWLGGMGIIVLAVAVIPMLGIGGMQLYRAETPGPVKYSKLTPRITQTAKTLWYLYVGLTIVCAIVYWAAGMNLFDAVGHSFSTVAIGGFSTHDESFAYFDSSLIMYIGAVLMIVSGINFALHFLAWRTRSFLGYFQDVEVRAYLTIIGAGILITWAVLFATETYDGIAETVKHGLFQVVSFATTSGFTTVDVSLWPLHLPAMLLAASIIGGCAGSTAGGMKVIRVVLLFKQGHREMLKLIHPNAIIPIRVNKSPVPDTVANAIWGFFALYVLCFVVLSLILMAMGTNLITAYSTVTACLNNLGPALGDAANGYADLGSGPKWVLAFTMLLGRLELLTLLVLFTARYWRD